MPRARLLPQDSLCITARPPNRLTPSGDRYRFERELGWAAYVALNEPEKAMDQVEILLTTPSYFAPGWFRVDPNFASLRGNPRFERLLKAGT
jgi:hypothetical protein